MKYLQQTDLLLGQYGVAVVSTAASQQQRPVFDSQHLAAAFLCGLWVALLPSTIPSHYYWG